jgi:hypothetical protein
MKVYVTILLLYVYQLNHAQDFSAEQYKEANTAQSVPYLTETEKEAILYVNLARLYPKLFLLFVVENYNGPAGYAKIEKSNTYLKSLKKKLGTLESMKALNFDSDLYENAKCFSEETGKSGGVGHQRKLCPKKNFAECISYGMQSGKDVAMQWLLDDGVPSLGHRNIVLDPTYNKIGLSVHAHKKWETCAVAEIIW